MNKNQGHRERLRKRFLMSGISGFHEYEILELLLTYVIVQKDCKPIAKKLLEKYGNLYTLLGQSSEELQKNNYSIAINQTMAGTDTTIKDQDVIAFLPPFAGG